METKERRIHAGKKYFLKKPEAEVELVRTMHNTTFCAYCTRLRVTSNAELKTLLVENGQSRTLKRGP